MIPPKVQDFAETHKKTLTVEIQAMRAQTLLSSLQSLLTFSVPLILPHVALSF